VNFQYVQPLREEVEVIVEKEGWSKAALAKMRKVDSFIRECQRMEGFDALSTARKAMKDFTFSDGTFIPKGMMIGAATRCLHYDAKFYKNANVFEPFRFAEMNEEGSDGAKHQFVSTAIEYLPFGHGKQVWYRVSISSVTDS
jgi:cytochrome P450